MQSRQLLMMVTLLGTGLVLMTSGHALGQVFEQDHLKCYKVLKDSNPVGSHVVDLLNRQFGEEKECKVNNKAAYLCAPTRKVSVDGSLVENDPFGFAIDNITDDYLCYKLRCPNPKETTVVIRDQFSVPGQKRELTIKPAQLLCTPVQKLEPPPTTPCEQSGPPLCGGVCTSPLLKCTATPNGCFCLD